MILFAVRQKFRPTLHFGIVCLLVALRLLTTDERHLLQFVPNLDWSLLIKLEYGSYYLAVPAFERIMIEIALKHTAGRRRDAALLLGWGRNTLTRKIKELGMKVDGGEEDDDA